MGYAVFCATVVDEDEGENGFCKISEDDVMFVTSFDLRLCGEEWPKNCAH